MLSDRRREYEEKVTKNRKGSDVQVALVRSLEFFLLIRVRDL